MQQCRGTTRRLIARLGLEPGHVLKSTPDYQLSSPLVGPPLIAAVVPAHLDVHVILDNLSTHKTPAVHKWLLRHRRFHFHFTPTYGSWMNMVERWFGALTTKKLQRSAHDSVAELAADITAWVDIWNEDPKPFVWTKTADQILDRLARYCTDVTATQYDSASN